MQTLDVSTIRLSRRQGQRVGQNGSRSFHFPSRRGVRAMSDSESLAACVGIDWADKRHAVCLAIGDGEHEIAAIEQTPEAIDAWAQALYERFGGRPIGVCLEQRRGPLACYRMYRARGMRHHAALRGLAFKWIRVLIRCWKSQTPYNETHHFQALERTNSPLLTFLPAV
jgi:hypothetical protein